MFSYLVLTFGCLFFWYAPPARYFYTRGAYPPLSCSPHAKLKEFSSASWTRKAVIKQSGGLFYRPWESPTTGTATPTGESHHRESLSCSPHAKLKEFSSASGARKAVIKQSGGLFYRPRESPTTGKNTQPTNATKPPTRGGFVAFGNISKEINP